MLTAIEQMSMYAFKLLLNLEIDAGHDVERCARDGGIRPVGDNSGDCLDGDLVVIEVVLILKM